MSQGPEDSPQQPKMPPLPPNHDPDLPEEVLSLISPGNPVRELIHELRNARLAINMAQRTFVKRSEIEAEFSTKQELTRTRRNLHRSIAGICATLALLIVTAGWAYWSARTYRWDQYHNCMARNAQNAASIDFTRKYIAIQTRSQDQDTARRVIELIKEAQKKAPVVQPDCSKLKP